MIPNDILLLKIIEFDGKLSLLQNRGLSYSQIARLLEKQKDNGNIEFKENGLYLTPKGQQRLIEYNLSHDFNHIFFVRQEHLFFEPISEKEVFLPKERDIR